MAVLHDGERVVPVAAAEQAVGAVRQAVLMQRTGDKGLEDQGDDRRDHRVGTKMHQGEKCCSGRQQNQQASCGKAAHGP
ncbi:hypothetical protein D3C87_2103350 [compost metagenome]